MSECSRAQASLDAPIACSLRDDDLTTRQRWLAKVMQKALKVDRSARGMTAAFSPDAKFEVELRTLAQAESECCPFLRITVRRSDDALELDVAGPAAARPVIDEMFASRA
jgi:hypothetical protein